MLLPQHHVVHPILSNGFTVTSHKGFQFKTHGANAEFRILQWYRGDLNLEMAAYMLSLPSMIPQLMSIPRLLDDGAPIYSELQIVTELPVDTDSASVLLTANTLFDLIRGLPMFSWASSDPMSAVYRAANMTC